MIWKWMKKTRKSSARKKTAPREGELVVSGSRAVNGGELWNPDDVIRRKGFTYLRRMDQRNGFLYGLMRSRIEAVKRLGWMVNPSGPGQEDVHVAAFVNDVMLRMEGAFGDDLAEMLDAVKYGYSVLEIVWEPWKSEKYGDRWAIRALRARKQDDFRFTLDRHGNVVGLVQVTPKRTVLPLQKFVCCTFDPEPGNPYGRGLYSRLYWHDWFMREGWKFWAVAAERYGAPVVKMQVPRNASAETRDEARELLENLNSSSGLVIPEDIEVGLLEAVRGGQMTFGEFIDSQKEPMQIAILGQTLTSTVGDRGSRALGEIHQQVRNEIIESDAAWLYTLVNEQIVRRLVDHNFAHLTGYPTLSPPERTNEDLEKTARTLREVSALGVEMPKAWLYRRFGIPMPEVSEAG
jgi:phage gp29-like protein